MSYIVMECNKGYAVVMDNSGRFIKAANLNYAVGQKLDNIVAYNDKLYSKSGIPVYAKRIASIAACICFIFIGSCQLMLTTYGTVRMQINPDVEISFNRLEYVTKIRGLNSDGEELIDGIKYFGKKTDEIANELTQRAIENGTLSNDGQILLTINTKNEKKTATVEDKVVLNLTIYLEEKNEKTNDSNVNIKKQEENQTLIDLSTSDKPIQKGNKIEVTESILEKPDTSEPNKNTEKINKDHPQDRTTKESENIIKENPIISQPVNDTKVKNNSNVSDYEEDSYNKDSENKWENEEEAEEKAKEEAEKAKEEAEEKAKKEAEKAKEEAEEKAKKEAEKAKEEAEEKAKKEAEKAKEEAEEKAKEEAEKAKEEAEEKAKEEAEKAKEEAEEKAKEEAEEEN